MKPRDENKIKEIYKATLTVVAETGIAGITMSDVAKSAGIATGTLYIYFDSKEALINKLYVYCRQQSAKAFFKEYDESENFEKCFRLIFSNIIRRRYKNFNEILFMEQSYHSPFVSEQTRMLARTFFTPLFDVINRGKKEKKFKSIDTRLLIAFMIGNITEMVKHHLYNREKLTDDTIRLLYKMTYDGMRR